ncbi:MAG: CHC2 zinc finger domain-containing protein, partial [Desulfovibrionales bacterium]
MGGVDSSAIEEVKARLNIADVVGRYLELRPAGNRFMGPCPFHHETKPSFSVSPDLGFYYCFGCQASGDVIDFFCRINGLEFREGLEQLAQEAGVELVSDPAARQRGRVRTRMLEMHSQAQAFFRKVLASGAGQGPRSYLEQRGMVPEVMDRFGI